MRRSKLPVVQALNSPEESVLQLTAASVWHQRLNMLPLLAVLVDQRDQAEVLFQCPLFAVEVRLEKIFVVVLELLESAVGKKLD